MGLRRSVRELNLTHEYLTSFQDRDDWKMLDRINTVVFSTPLKFKFVTFYPTRDYAATIRFTLVTENDNLDAGALKIGPLKNPTETRPVVFDGFQESNVDEGRVLGDSVNGCVSLWPSPFRS
ncbi:hypothetical protein CTA2_13018 [Colletotrichum tanaceti]|uniref:Uncharacterized protein n=1 Tax=Colletotrichum tanaceti TaxID=1306861 RepID=A0A4U6XIC7_9PEZI|nr:hypothetical protein CTA2_13018 [Colletotrichum tanaceti]TKW55718.1 hypothetical protein CTA1_9854 [Colletotrichum tanaceti]